MGGGAFDDPREYERALARARDERDEAEWALSSAVERILPQADAGAGFERCSRDSLSSAMEPGTALVQFVTFVRCLDPEGTGPLRTRADYGALVLSKTGSGGNALAFVGLGPASSIDSLVFEYRETIDGADAGRRPTAREEARFRRAARALYQAVWSPLIPRIPTAGPDGPEPAVFIIADSYLHLLDFNTMLSPAGRLVIEDWRLHYLSSAGDLLRDPAGDRTGTGMLAVGNPGPFFGSTDAGAGGSADTGERSGAVHLAAVRETAPLPGAGKEAESVADLFRSATGEETVVLIGERADENTVKQSMGQKRIAHLSCHGFFCGAGTREKIPFIEVVDNSLFMSGLVLSRREGECDGMLTAYEVAGLDLRGLDWVVLSACGSGLGKLVWGEGIYGLGRAFEHAGARTVIMALWRVDDLSMRELMEGLYRYRLSGYSTIDAVRQAQIDRLHEQRTRSNRVHPVRWGGLIAEGDWR